MGHYTRFGITLAVSLLLMFVLSMSMIVSLDHFYLNLSNFYMALIMVAAMGVVMLLSMWNMYEDRRINAILLVVFVGGFLGALVLGRTSALVGDRQFLESMIPHHSRAILVCQESTITDPEIITVCGEIIQTQREEIAQKEAILERY